MDEMYRLRYPIGEFKKPTSISLQDLKNWKEEIGSLPIELRQAVRDLSDEQLDTTYRPGGWTIRQVIHHLADSHMNAFIRFKLALTEDSPTIRPYKEELWAELSDSKNLPLSSSLSILEGLHNRWVQIMESMDEDDYNKTYFHPEHEKYFNLQEVLGTYAWHGKHHLGHILQCKRNNNWI